MFAFCWKMIDLVTCFEFNQVQNKFCSSLYGHYDHIYQGPQQSHCDADRFYLQVMVWYSDGYGTGIMAKGYGIWIYSFLELLRYIFSIMKPLQCINILLTWFIWNGLLEKKKKEFVWKENRDYLYLLQECFGLV